MLSLRPRPAVIPAAPIAATNELIFTPSCERAMITKIILIIMDADLLKNK